MRRPILPFCFLLLALGCSAPPTSDGEAPPTSEGEESGEGAPAEQVVQPAIPPRGVVEASDGLEIAYEARGEGETTVVLVHCWACDKSFWRHQIVPLAERRRVVALDLPGHGDSGTDREIWSIEGLAEDVVTVLEQLDLEHAVLVGHSMGGPVSLVAAASAPERVIGVVLVDTVHDAEMEWTEADAEPIVTAYRQDFEGTNQQFVPMMFPEDADRQIVASVIERANATDRDAAVALMADFPNIDYAEILSAVEVPVRAVNAAPLGQMIPATAVETNRRYADYDAAILEGVGHYLMLEKPQEFNALLEAAIAGIESD